MYILVTIVISKDKNSVALGLPLGPVLASIFMVEFLRS